jgi:hypothetical protein
VKFAARVLCTLGVMAKGAGVLLKRAGLCKESSCAICYTAHSDSQLCTRVERKESRWLRKGLCMNCAGHYTKSLRVKPILRTNLLGDNIVSARVTLPSIPAHSLVFTRQLKDGKAFS